MNQSLIAISAFVLLSILIYLDNKLLKISRYQIKSGKIPKEFNNFKIVHLSDFHSHVFIGHNNKIVAKINEESPDIIVMTGDMVNKYDNKFDRFLELAEALGKKYKVYYIVGNHEQRLKQQDLKFILNKLMKFGIEILDDKKVTIKRDKALINIYGINIPLSFYRIRHRPTNIDEIINSKLRRCNSEEYNILLAHNPLYFDKYARHSVNLVLSGHVHGGMIRVPFIGGLLSPERTFFPKYCSGVYKINHKKLVVSRGIGHSKPLFRILNMPEILSITLMS